MIGEGIQEDVLRALVEQHTVRECLVAKINGGPTGACLFAWVVAAHAGCRCARAVSRCALGPV
jgi:hypothetical protein